MSPPRFAMAAVWREPSSLQTPGNLGEGELVQLQCRYPCSAGVTFRTTREKLAEMEVISPLKCRGVCTRPHETACIFRLCRALSTNLSGYWTTASGSEETTVVLLSVSISELLNCLHTYFQLLSNPSADTTSFNVCVKYSHHLWKKKWKHLVASSKGGCE